MSMNKKFIHSLTPLLFTLTSAQLNINDIKFHQFETMYISLQFLKLKLLTSEVCVRPINSTRQAAQSS
jgi:hypothetical protein